ncbi:hypothetical protein [Feifania hominis]|uniref:M42 family peptidase n=1 Tax=Feifania hominis TaxID=2763660 RepID=A0A926HTE5_9FIRM|nr:hypothetical protein [Feifania hominis]MBC8535789.1 M42 family peptidase [Feifania hominis]
MDINRVTEICKDLMLTPGLCGYESLVAKKMKAYMEAYTDDVRLDKIGNMIATFPGTDPEAPKIMMFAHMDQLGFIVRRIDDDGFIRVDRMGGIPEKVLPASAVWIGKEDGSGYVQGVFGVKPHHKQSAEEKFTVNTIPELYIDIGALCAQEVYDAGIQVGCPVVYEPAFTELLNHRALGTSGDNRKCCTALIEAAEIISQKPHASTIYLVGTVWEEFNLRGAMMANRTAPCDIGICLDGSLAADTPDLKNNSVNNTVYEGGPVISAYSFHGRGTLNGTIAHKGLYDRFIKVAKELNMPYQVNAAIGGLSDTSYLQLENDGVACINVGATSRYNHSPGELSGLLDVQMLGILAGNVCLSIDKSFDLHRF